jgi:hypothetical protein
MPKPEDPPRSAQARAATEQALVAVAYQFGSTPPFVLLGGLVPGLPCSNPATRHAGTTDVDVQVDLEFQSGGGRQLLRRVEKLTSNLNF